MIVGLQLICIGVSDSLMISASATPGAIASRVSLVIHLHSLGDYDSIHIISTVLLGVGFLSAHRLSKLCATILGRNNVGPTEIGKYGF